MTVFAHVEVSEATFREAEPFLTRLELELRTGVMEKALRAAAAPVVKWAKALAPQSAKTGSFLLWSQKVRQLRVGTKPHAETIGTSSVRSYSSGTFAIYVGPLYPAGNLINVIGHAHAQVLWGRHTGTTIQPTKYLEQASQITIQEQSTAFKAKVQSETEKILAKR